MTALIQQHRGWVVDAPDDNLLAEFTSGVDAVTGAVEIQRKLAERNVELTDERKMHFRIGVNVGDVVEEEDRIYGDGVNIAARVQEAAEADSVFVSQSLFEQGVLDGVQAMIGVVRGEYQAPEKIPSRRGTKVKGTHLGLIGFIFFVFLISMLGKLIRFFGLGHSQRSHRGAGWSGGFSGGGFSSGGFSGGGGGFGGGGASGGW
jgi:hypothetical protein